MTDIGLSWQRKEHKIIRATTLKCHKTLILPQKKFSLLFPKTNSKLSLAYRYLREELKKKTKQIKKQQLYVEKTATTATTTPSIKLLKKELKS